LHRNRFLAQKSATCDRLTGDSGDW
jgi:hypothetical protein